MAQKKKVTKENDWLPPNAKKVETPIIEWWNPEVGDRIAGEMLRSFQGRFGTTFILETPDGTEIGLPHNVDLMTKVAKLGLGTMVFIERGEDGVSSRGQAMKQFEVYIT